MIEPNRQGEVWVYAEQEDGSLNDVSLELCGKARDLADRLGVKTGVVLPGAGVKPLAAQLIAHGADTVTWSMIRAYRIIKPRRTPG
jgi:electron transfer flavoprotein alpha subunit